MGNIREFANDSDVELICFLSNGCVAFGKEDTFKSKLSLEYRKHLQDIHYFWNRGLDMKDEEIENTAEDTAVVNSTNRRGVVGEGSDGTAVY